MSEPHARAHLTAVQDAISQPDATAMELQDRFHRWNQTRQFHKGDLVTFKHGFDIRPVRRAGQPMLVMQSAPLFVSGWREAADPRRPIAAMYDVVVMELLDDGTAVMQWADSPRLEPWPRRDAAATEGA